MAELLVTPSQTIGPFFAEALRWPAGDKLFPDTAPGRRISLGGAVFDAAGSVVPDALIEFWQADGAGRYGGPREGSCTGFGRVMTDASGRYAISTVMPGQLKDVAGRPQAPHVLVVLFARGLLKQVVTRVYFEGEPANASDPVLALCGRRADTLIARQGPADPSVFQWNVILQGERETVFFEV